VAPDPDPGPLRGRLEQILSRWRKASTAGRGTDYDRVMTGPRFPDLIRHVCYPRAVGLFEG